MLFHQSITGEARGWQQEWKLSINTSNLLARKAGVFCCFIHTCKEQPVPLFPSAAVRKSNLYFLTEHIPSLCLHSYGLSPFHFINTGMNYEPPEEVSYLMPYLRSIIWSNFKTISVYFYSRFPIIKKIKIYQGICTYKYTMKWVFPSQERGRE